MIVNDIESCIAQATQLQRQIGLMEVALKNAAPHGRNQPSERDLHLHTLAVIGLKAISAFNDHFTSEIGRQM